MPPKHNALREGAQLGFIVAAAIWLWLVIVDAIAGQPFRTFAVLGGLALFTVLHCLLNVVYAVVIVSTIHRAMREPSLLIALAFGFFIVEFAFVMLTMLLAHVGLGQLAWVRILGGNLIRAAIGFVILYRTHPLQEELRRAEDEERE
ncbi:MAG TPA: hypothetical protein VEM13_11795 [Gemmatimonadales bacterium]|nr:hypothetical protein [Gemmatimonadales bacterium]